jgi:hypothetical protein
MSLLLWCGCMRRFLAAGANTALPGGRLHGVECGRTDGDAASGDIIGHGHTMERPSCRTMSLGPGVSSHPAAMHQISGLGRRCQRKI